MTKTSIRLTGRKSLPHSAFSFDWNETTSGVVCTLDVLDKGQVRNFPPDARVQVMLSENKSVHFADFGTLENMSSSVSLEGVSWVSPSAELRIAHNGHERNHLLLASAKLPKSNNSGDAEGILHFQKRDTSPFLWELSVEEDAFPTLYLSEKMEAKVDPIIWVKSSPVFLISVFPTVIEKVFQKIFETDGKMDEGWMYLWVLWAEKTMGCEKFPSGSDPDEFSTWLTSATSTILAKMDLLPEALATLVGQEVDK
jgi:hypothetical protein